MHWLTQGSRIVNLKPGVIMATQYFKRNLLLNLYGLVTKSCLTLATPWTVAH